jgi:hypothetical protein
MLQRKRSSGQIGSSKSCRAWSANAECRITCVQDCFLDEIDRLIDWKPIEKVLRQKLKRVVNAVSNLAYPPLLMLGSAHETEKIVR